MEPYRSTTYDTVLFVKVKWLAREVSNLQSSDPKSDVLPTRLLANMVARMGIAPMVFRL